MPARSSSVCPTIISSLDPGIYKWPKAIAIKDLGWFSKANALCFLTLVSGGFAVVQPDSQLSINAVEGYPLEEFSSEVGLFTL